MIHDIPMGVRFSLLHRAFRRKMDEMLSEKDLTGVQFGVLQTLVRLEIQGQSEISQRDLEQAGRISHATMTDILRRLEKKGFVSCEQSSRDRRFKVIASTEKARLLKDDAHRVEEETLRWLCRGLAPEQMEALTAITDVMLRNVWESCEKGCDENHD